MTTYTSSLLASLLVCAYSAQLQAATAQNLDTLVVQGQGQSSIQVNTGGSNTRLDSIRLEDANVTTLIELEKMVPGLKISNQGVSRLSMNSLRGIGDITRQDYFNSSLAIIVDGVYIPPAELDLSLLNIKSVEVIRGPQNAIYGRNAIAGAIKITTQDLKGNEGVKITLGAGNKHSWLTTLSATGEIHENLTANVTLNTDGYDGFIDNMDDGESLDDRKNLQLSTRFDWQIQDRLKAQLNLNYIDKTLGLSGNLPLAQYTQRITDITGGNNEEFDIRNSDLLLAYKGDSVNFRSTTSYHDFENRMHMDLGYTSAPGMVANYQFPKGTPSSSIETGKVLSQKFEWQNQASKDTSLDWLIGLQFDREKHFYDYKMATMFQTKTDYTRKDYSAFAQGEWHLNPLLSLKSALRFTREDHSATGTVYALDSMTGATMIMPIAGNKKENILTPSIELTYRPNEYNTYFTRLARGVRGGGLDRIQMLKPFNKETITTAEIGFKTLIPKHNFSLSTSLFYNDWRDMQVKQFYSLNRYNILNAAEAKSYGIEAEANWQVSSNLNLFMNALVLKSELSKFNRGLGQDLSGNRMPNMPENSATLGGTWRQPLEQGGYWMLAADYNWKGKHYFDVENQLSESYGLFNLKTGLEFDAWQVHFWAKNLLDKDYLLYAYKDEFGLDVATPGRGREYGLTLKAQF